MNIDDKSSSLWKAKETGVKLLIQSNQHIVGQQHVKHALWFRPLDGSKITNISSKMHLLYNMFHLLVYRSKTGGVRDERVSYNFTVARDQSVLPGEARTRNLCIAQSALQVTILLNYFMSVSWHFDTCEAELAHHSYYSSSWPKVGPSIHVRYIKEHPITPSKHNLSHNQTTIVILNSEALDRA